MAVQLSKSAFDQMVLCLCCLAALLFLMPAPSAHSTAHQFGATSSNVQASSDLHVGHVHHDYEDNTTADNHHHADHTHEKGGMVVKEGDCVWPLVEVAYLAVNDDGAHALYYGIDRPPRKGIRA